MTIAMLTDKENNQNREGFIAGAALLRQELHLQPEKLPEVVEILHEIWLSDPALSAYIASSRTELILKECLCHMEASNHSPATDMLRQITAETPTKGHN